MSEHRCDESFRENAVTGAITATRALRMMLATVDDAPDFGFTTAKVLEEVDGCRNCLSAIVTYQVAALSGPVFRQKDVWVPHLEKLLSKALAELDEDG